MMQPIMIIERTVFMARTMDGRAGEIKHQKWGRAETQPPHAWLWKSTIRLSPNRTTGARARLAHPVFPGTVKCLHGRTKTGSVLTAM